MSKAFSFQNCRASQVVVCDDDADYVRRCAKDLAGGYAERSLHDEELLADIEVCAGELTQELRRTLISFRDHSNHQGSLLLAGLPVESDVPTPLADGADQWTRTPLATVGQLLVMSLIGRPYSFTDEKEGRLVQDVFAKLGHEKRQENSGSVLMELHTEAGFHPNAPKWLGLLCVRGDRQGQGVSVTGSVLTALGHLDPASLEVLRRPNFRIRISSSFTGRDRIEYYSTPHAVLTGDPDEPDLLLDANASEASTEEGAAALAALVAAIEANLVGFLPEPGDLVIVDNRRAVHGRTAFSPRYDGADRWLRRVLATSDLRALRACLDTGRALQSLRVPG